jgi:hypothetical protein
LRAAMLASQRIILESVLQAMRAAKDDE